MYLITRIHLRFNPETHESMFKIYFKETITLPECFGMPRSEKYTTFICKASTHSDIEYSDTPLNWPFIALLEKISKQRESTWYLPTTSASLLRKCVTAWISYELRSFSYCLWRTVKCLKTTMPRLFHEDFSSIIGTIYGRLCCAQNPYKLKTRPIADPESVVSKKIQFS